MDNSTFLKDGTELREHKKYNYRSLMRRSYCTIDCPYCGTSVTAYVWSLSGSGKKCPNKNCGALHGGWGKSIMKPKTKTK